MNDAENEIKIYKKENKKMIKIEIKNRFTGTVIFGHEAENNTMQLTVETAVSEPTYTEPA